MPEKVSIVECNSYNTELVYIKIKEALALINFEDIKKGDKVLLKPNLILAKPPERAATTHPSILDAVCRILNEKGAEIWIGDSSGAFLFGGTKSAFEISGIADIAKKWSAKLLCFETCPIIQKSITNGQILSKIELAEPVFKADYIINLPKLKTHNLTKLTCAIKNLYGCIPGGRKLDYHKIAGSEKRFSELLIDIYQQIKVNLTIVDAIEGMEGNGPIAGEVKKTNLILASKNPVAVDFVASKIIGFKPEEISYLNLTIKKGLCPTIEVVGKKDASVPYKKSSNPINHFLPDFIRNRIESRLLPEVYINQETCRKCMVCFKACPQKTISLNTLTGELSINKKNCIHCYCCYELCPYESIKLRDTFLIRLAKKIFRS